MYQGTTFQGLCRPLLINVDQSPERSGDQAVYILSKPSVFSWHKKRCWGKIWLLFSSTCRAILLEFTLIISWRNDVGANTGVVFKGSRFPRLAQTRAPASRRFLDPPFPGIRNRNSSASTIWFKIPLSKHMPHTVLSVKDNYSAWFSVEEVALYSSVQQNKNEEVLSEFIITRGAPMAEWPPTISLVRSYPIPWF